jgi:hypothetical protein
MTPKKVKSVCIPLDPDDCGSVIHGYVRFPELVQRDYGKKLWEVEQSASVSLSDCNRIIQWNLTDDGITGAYNIDKLDIAISALTELRKYMSEANAELKKMNKERARRNRALDPEWKED